MNFNLVDEDWIPVLYSDGTWTRVGIRQAFQDAHNIRQIAATNPMDRVAILRFLLAVLYWCNGSPDDDKPIPKPSRVPDNWFSKLAEEKGLFEMLGDGRRFYQDETARRHRPTTELLQEVPTGNNFQHLRHSSDFHDGLCKNCCALGLLRLPLFSVSGLPDLKSGINGTPPIYLVPIGNSLLETLLLNWQPVATIGNPEWSPDSIPTTTAESVPLLAGLTMLARRVWLGEPDVVGDCVGCGSNESLIRICQFQSAGKQESDLWDDPHVVYSDTTPRKKSKATDLTAPGRFAMDRPWPYLFLNLAESAKFYGGHDTKVLLVVGFATDKAKNIDVWERKVYLSANNDENITNTRSWHKRASVIEKQLDRSEVRRKAAVSSIRPQIEHAVSERFGYLSSEFGAFEAAAEESRPLIRCVTESLSPGFSAAAQIRRSRIHSTVSQFLTNPAQKKGTQRDSD